MLVQLLTANEESSFAVRLTRTTNHKLLCSKYCQCLQCNEVRSDALIRKNL